MNASLLDGHLLDGHAVVLFDGVCNLCNASVTFVIDHDPRGYFRFSPLESSAEHLLLQGVVRENLPDSIVLLEASGYYTQSDAALRIARRLSGAWPLLYALIVVPRPLRNHIYAWIARHRYKWFGRTDACRVPTPELRERFLEL